MSNNTPTPHQGPLLAAHDLSRVYKTQHALLPTSFTLQAGDLAILRGANGAGKSTLLLCLSGLLRPSTGRVEIAGHDLYQDEQAAKRHLAFVPDVPRFYVGLTAWEHLRFIALAHHAGDDFEARAEILLREFGLWEARDQFPHAYSRGMRLKLGLLTAFIRPFRVLLLDEPTSALDASSISLLAHKLNRLQQEGITLLLTAHDQSLTDLVTPTHQWQMHNGRLQQR